MDPLGKAKIPFGDLWDWIPSNQLRAAMLRNKQGVCRLLYSPAGVYFFGEHWCMIFHKLSFWFPMPFGFPKSFMFPHGPWLQVTCFSALLLGQLCVLLSEAQRPTLGFGLALGALLLSHKARQAPGFGRKTPHASALNNVGSGFGEKGAGAR